MTAEVIDISAKYVDNGKWQVEVHLIDDKGVATTHPHSPFTIQLQTSYDRPLSITGLVCQEIACKLLHR